MIGNSAIDDWIKAVTKPPSSQRDSMEAVLAAHGNVMNLFKQISGGDKRSLASKYLHFHRPKYFYIYDSRAVAGMRLLTDVLGKARKARKAPYDGADPEYSRFVQRCVRLRGWIKQNFGAALLPRQIDNLLLDIFAVGESPGLPNRGA